MTTERKNPPWSGEYEIYIAFESISNLPIFVGLGKPHVEAQIEAHKKDATDPVHGYPYHYNITGPWKLKDSSIVPEICKWLMGLEHARESVACGSLDAREVEVMNARRGVYVGIAEDIERKWGSNA